MGCQGRRTPSMKASYVAMTKQSSSDPTKDLIKQELQSYSPSTPSVSADSAQGRAQRQKK